MSDPTPPVRSQPSTHASVNPISASLYHPAPATSAAIVGSVTASTITRFSLNPVFSKVSMTTGTPFSKVHLFLDDSDDSPLLKARTEKDDYAIYPPVKQIDVGFDRYGHIFMVGMVENEKGVTVGQVVKAFCDGFRPPNMTQRKREDVFGDHQFPERYRCRMVGGKACIMIDSFGS